MTFTHAATASPGASPAQPGASLHGNAQYPDPTSLALGRQIRRDITRGGASHSTLFTQGVNPRLSPA